MPESPAETRAREQAPEQPPPPELPKPTARERGAEPESRERGAEPTHLEPTPEFQRRLDDFGQHKAERQEQQGGADRVPQQRDGSADRTGPTGADPADGAAPVGDRAADRARTDDAAREIAASRATPSERSHPGPDGDSRTPSGHRAERAIDRGGDTTTGDGRPAGADRAVADRAGGADGDGRRASDHADADAAARSQAPARPADRVDGRVPDSVPDSVPDGSQPREAPAEARTGSTDRGDGVPRYSAEDLSGTGRHSTLYGTELMEGADGKNHFTGDRVGTYRDAMGKPHDAQTHMFVRDDNPQAKDAAQTRADRDVVNARQFDLSDAANDGHPVADHARDAADGVREAATRRQEIADQRAETWATLEPLVAKVAAVTGDDIGPTDVHPRRLDGLVERAGDALDDVEQMELMAAGEDFAAQGAALGHASESLGIAGGEFVMKQELGDVAPLTGGVDERGRPEQLDRTVVLAGEPPSLVVYEEKGVGGDLGSRLVAAPDDPSVRYRAEQGSPEYLRDLLQRDPQLAEAADRDPTVRDRLQQAVDSGNVRYVIVHTSADGVVTAIDCRLDPARLRPDTLRVLGEIDRHAAR